MRMKQKILVVDDEPDIVDLIRNFFLRRGYDILAATGGEDAIKKAEQQPDLILLDINMPDIDGITVLKTIREHVGCPILLLTANIEDADKIGGLSAGADDYIVKPFSLEELEARVAAHLRRELRHRTSAKLSFDGDLVIDYSARCVYFENRPLQLAKKEFDIVELLSQHAGQIFDKERIYESIWGFDSEGDSTVVAEHIRRVRAKFAAAGVRAYIETVWGVGYKWAK